VTSIADDPLVKLQPIVAAGTFRRLLDDLKLASRNSTLMEITGSDREPRFLLRGRYKLSSPYRSGDFAASLPKIMATYLLSNWCDGRPTEQARSAFTALLQSAGASEEVIDLLPPLPATPEGVPPRWSSPRFPTTARDDLAARLSPEQNPVLQLVLLEGRLPITYPQGVAKLRRKGQDPASKNNERQVQVNHPNDSPVVDVEVQMRLEQDAPLRLEPFVAMVNALGLTPPTALQLPIRTEADKAKLTEYWKPCASALLEARRDNQGLIPNAQRVPLIDLYRYLTCSAEAPTPDERRTIDVIWVPGARGTFQMRIWKALELALQTDSGRAQFIFSGKNPGYDSGWDYTEAEALQHVLDGELERIREKGVNPRSFVVHLEKQSESLYQNFEMTKETIVSIAANLQRSVTVAVVNAGYVMRRTLLTGRAVWADLPVSLSPTPSPTNWDIHTIMSPHTSDESLEKGFGFWCNEAIKILCGRAIGQH
jgi:uncharacterized SAM-binding protein YcdF (DUF218 family)